MRYHLYKPGDFESLYAVEEVCFKPPQRFTRPYLRKLIESPGVATWIADEAERMAGFAIVEWGQQTSGIIAYIPTIEVLPEWRGQGIGSELLRRLEDTAATKSAIVVWLHVDAENAPAIRLYERSGYQNNGRADHYYACNRPASIYVKHLI